MTLERFRQKLKEHRYAIGSAIAWRCLGLRLGRENIKLRKEIAQISGRLRELADKLDRACGVGI